MRELKSWQIPDLIYSAQTEKNNGVKNNKNRILKHLKFCSFQNVLYFNSIVFL